MDKKNLLLMIIISILIITGLYFLFHKNGATEKALAPSTEKEISTDIKNDKRLNSIQKFLGKPTVILIGGTYCPHCKETVPEFKTQIFDKYGDKINIFVNVVDQKKFDVADIPQGFDENLTFDVLTGEKCNYVPAWVVLDNDGKAIDKSCGASRGVNDVKTTLESIL